MSYYEIPAIGLSEAATENLGKYGRMRKRYLQAHDPMRWAGLMNCCKTQVEEIIFAELIYN